MDLIGYTYYQVESHEGHRQFGGRMRGESFSNMSFTSFEKAAEWLEGLTIDNKEVAEQIKTILHSEQPAVADTPALETLGSAEPVDSQTPSEEIAENEHVQELLSIMEDENMEKSTDPRYFILNDSIPELHTYKMVPMYDEYPDYVTYESTLYVPRPSKDDFLILEEDELSIASLKLDSSGEFKDFAGVLLRHNFNSNLDFLNVQIERGIIRESSEVEYKEQYSFATRPFFAKIECYDEQDELVNTLLCKSRSDCRWTIEDAMNYYDRIDTKEISEAEYMTLKEQQEASQTAEKEEPIVTPIAENEHVQELLTIMDDNKSPDRQELIAVLNHLSTLERQLDAALKEVAALRIEQANVQKQNQPTHDLMNNSVSVMQGGLQSLKNRLDDLKQQFIEGCKNAVADFKQRGISALDTVVRLFKVRPALEAVNNQLDKSIHFAETTVSKIEAVSAEYHEAGRHIQNMARAATGKEIVSEAKPMGKLTKSLEAPFKAEYSLLSSMKKSADAALSHLTVLEQSAGRSMITVSDQIRESSKSEDVLFFGKIEFAQSEGKSETILYDDKGRYDAAASAQAEFGVQLTATEISAEEFTRLKEELCREAPQETLQEESVMEFGSD